MLLSAPKLTTLGLMLAGLILPASNAEAQYGYGYGWGGVRVGAPGVGVSVGRYGGVRVRAPGVYYSGPSRSYYRGFYGPRPFVRGSYSYSYFGPGISVSGGAYAPGTYAPGAIVTNETVVSSSPTLAESPESSVADPRTAAPAGRATGSFASGFPTEAQLATMGDAELLAATSEASAALQSRLDGFDNGAGWQSYLAFNSQTDDNVVSEDSLLRRFDSVARDAKFSMIAGLEEFQAMRTALRVIVDRGGVVNDAQPPVPPQSPTSPVPPQSPAPPEPAEAEGLPAPEPNHDNGVRVNVNGGGVNVNVERSVLTR